ncbi:MAG TPA: extracellular solute-binding protein [Bdellovibrionota bacterium]|nr:extracellular solute-binding protein [Bdellovibrionota bacterium]
MTKSWLLALVLGFAVGGNAFAAKKELWVYTSIYKEYATPLAAAFEAKHPEYSVQVFQGGSEKIQAKIEAELVAGKPQADILLTSDPFWSADLEKRGVALAKPEKNYYSVMVLIAHQSVPSEQRPKSFVELTEPRFDRMIQSPSPLESGTAFSTVALLSRKYSWEYIRKLAGNHLASAGGNSSVIQKVESGEKKIGIVLLENALAAKKRGSPIDVIYPADGAIPIPSVQVRLKGSGNPEGAAKFAGFVLSAEGQGLLRNGYMYSVRKDVGAPEGAPTYQDVVKRSVPWDAALIQEVAAQSKEIKKRFAALVLD